MKTSHETARELIKDRTTRGYLEAFFFVNEPEIRESEHRDKGIFNLSREFLLKTAGEVSAIEMVANDLRFELESSISEEEFDAIDEYMCDEQFGMDIYYTRVGAGVSIKTRADDYEPALPAKWVEAVEAAIHKYPEVYWEEAFD